MSESFDPDIHAVNADGSPKLTTRGTFAKKRGPRKSTSPRRSTSKAPDYRPGINGFFQMVAVPLAFKAPADAAAVAHHGPQIAQALHDLAVERPEVAAVLERVLAVGPYGALIGATVPLVVQILHNHDVIPEQMAVSVGATPKQVILDQLNAQGQRMDEEMTHAA